MTFTDLAKSYVRTVVPLAVGLVVSLALRAGLDLHGYTPEVTALVTAVYYAAARAAEHYLSPRFGWLLGVAQAPLYGAVGHLKVKAGRTTGADHVVKISADTTQIVAALKAVQREAERTRKAVEGAVGAAQKRSNRS